MANQVSKDMEKNNIAVDTLNESIDERIRTLAGFVIANKSTLNNDYLKALAKQFNVDEINVADASYSVLKGENKK